MKPILQWDVQTDDGRRVRDVLTRMGRLDAARVFVNGRRAGLDELVEVGDRVEVYPQREPADAAAVSILAQRDGIVLAHKPAGMPTETTQLGADSLLTALMSQLSGGEVRAATRLDVQVSGIVVCTLGRDARRRLEKWRQDGQLQRTYVAIASGTVVEDAGAWRWPLGKLRDRAGRHRVAVEAKDPKPAVTQFTVRARAPEAVMLELRPETGRMHQLRAHASVAGVPFFGDRLYGGPRQMVCANGAVEPIDRIALHAAVVEMPTLRAESALPEALTRWWGLCTAST